MAGRILTESPVGTCFLQGEDCASSSNSVCDAVEIACAVLDQITRVEAVSLPLNVWTTLSVHRPPEGVNWKTTPVVGDTATGNSVEIAVVAYQHLGWSAAVVTSGEAVEGGFRPASA